MVPTLSPNRREIDMFIIVEWNRTYQDINIMLDVDGNTEIFPSYEDAEHYATEQCAFYYKIVELD